MRALHFEKELDFVEWPITGFELKWKFRSSLFKDFYVRLVDSGLTLVRVSSEVIFKLVF